MPLVLTYPLEILTTGSYTIYETPDGGRKYVEFNPGSTFYVPSITEEPRYLTIPESANLNATWMGREDGRRLIVDKWLTNGRQFLRESSFSVPIGPGAAQALEREGVLAEYPRVLEVLNSMSLTLGFHSPSAQSSDLIYTLRGTPMEDFCVIWYHQGLNVFEGYKKVKVPMFLVTVTDGKSQGACNPVTGMNQEGG
ncbi:MAG: hypothetical protein PWQ95_1892 [Thermococcaceae archaeon]|nr:hypothetical protein [Thermococcaceae archaeon]